MPRRRNEDYIMYINVDRLKVELQKVLREATNEVKNLLQSALIKNAKMLPMKDNEVKLANGGVTSDKARQEALIQSIMSDRVSTFEEYWEGVVYGTYVGAMEKDFKDSHIGWYYEIGTGEESNPELYRRYGMSASLGDVNPYRLPHVGAPIVSRSKRDGTWVDLGGNVRSTSSYVGGIGGDEIPKGSDGMPITTPEGYKKLKDKFRENIGEDIVAYEWYRKAVDEVSNQVLGIYTNAIRKFDIFDPKYKIFHLKEKHIVGEKWWRR